MRLVLVWPDLIRLWESRVRSRRASRPGAQRSASAGPRTREPGSGGPSRFRPEGRRPRRSSIAPSTYYAHHARPPSWRRSRTRSWLSGSRRCSRPTTGYAGCARCGGPRGATAGDHKRPRTTIPGKDARPEDRLNRDLILRTGHLVGRRPHLCADLGRVRGRRVRDGPVLPPGRGLAGVVHAAFRLRLDALEQTIWARRQEGHVRGGLIHHSDRGVQGEVPWRSGNERVREYVQDRLPGNVRLPDGTIVSRPRTPISESAAIDGAAVARWLRTSGQSSWWRRR